MYGLSETYLRYEVVSRYCIDLSRSSQPYQFLLASYLRASSATINQAMGRTFLFQWW